MTEFPPIFRYDGLESEIRDSLKYHTTKITALCRLAGRATVQIGCHLIEARKLLSHGEFHKWAKTEFGWSPRKTRYLMQLARHPKSANFADLPIDQSALFLLTAPTAPEAAMDEAIERATKGERVSPEIAKNMLAAYNQDFELSPSKTDLIEDHIGGNPRGEVNLTTTVDETLTPPIINALYKEGIIGVLVVDEISRQLDDVEEVRVKNVVSRFGITDPELIPMLDRLCQQGSAVFDEIEASGCIEVNGDIIRLPLANHLDLQRCLNEINDEHMIAASQGRKRELMEDLQVRIKQNLGENGPAIIVTDSLENLITTEPVCLALLVPGPFSPRAIASHMERNDYQFLAILAYRGDPLIKIGGKIIPASQARNYLLPSIGELIESLSNIQNDEPHQG